MESESVTKQVRDRIKAKVWQKQNIREWFEETFDPLIKSQDKVKQSIDQQQNALIGQLQDNQRAITTGLDRLNEDNQRVLELNESAGVQMNGETKSSDLGRIFNTEDLTIFNKYGIPPPKDWSKNTRNSLEDVLDITNDKIKSLADQFTDGFEGVLQRINTYVDNESAERARKEAEQATAKERMEAIRQQVIQALPEQRVDIRTDSTQPLLQIQEAINQGLEQIQLERGRKEQQLKEAQQQLTQLHLDKEQTRELEQLRPIQQEQLEQQKQQAEELYQMGLKYEKLFDETKRQMSPKPQPQQLEEIKQIYEEMKRRLDEQQLQLSQRPTHCAIILTSGRGLFKGSAKSN